MVVLRAFVETAAIGGIAIFWFNFTVESLKVIWHIISDSPKTIVKQKASSEPIVKKKVMCESCYDYFLDDGGELINGKLLCESCSDDLVYDQLEK